MVIGVEKISAHTRKEKKPFTKNINLLYIRKCIHSINYMIKKPDKNGQLWRPNHIRSTKIRGT